MPVVIKTHSGFGIIFRVRMGVYSKKWRKITLLDRKNKSTRRF